MRGAAHAQRGLDAPQRPDALGRGPAPSGQGERLVQDADGPRQVAEVPAQTALHEQDPGQRLRHARGHAALDQQRAGPDGAPQGGGVSLGVAVMCRFGAEPDEVLLGGHLCRGFQAGTRTVPRWFPVSAGAGGVRMCFPRCLWFSAAGGRRRRPSPQLFVGELGC
ncbi:hypothetical protein GCM10010404_59250 [Nonomuraea africana]